MSRRHVLKRQNAAAVKYISWKSKSQTLSKLWWQRFAKSKLGADKQIFDDLVKESVFLPVDAKQEAENFIPTIPCAKALEDVFVVGYDSNTTVLRERVNAKRLWDAVEGNAARVANAELLQHFFFNRAGKVGWTLDEVVDLHNRWNLLRAGEACRINYASMSNVLTNYWKRWRRKVYRASQQPPELLPATSPREPPVRRALRKKYPAAQVAAESAGQAASSSASGARGGNPFDGTDDGGFVSHDVTYNYKIDRCAYSQICQFSCCAEFGQCVASNCFGSDSRP